ncbi:MAG: SWIM zinc finger family protein [Anaerolineales bacterium]|nr:MAG: SWIM zinc finger family protein [Anaerolineales bacterium]
MALPKITESMIRVGATPESFRRGEEYYRESAISNTSIQGTLLSGECGGTYAPYYRVQVELDEAGITDASCTCLYEYGGYCKHIVALLLAYLHHPKSFAVRKAPAELLADLDHNDLTAILTKLIQEQPDLYDRIEAMTSAPSKTKKKRKKKVDIEVYRRHILGIVHSLDGMRMSEAYWHVGGLANQLREVQESALKFLDAGDAETALEILLALLEEASRGIEYIDDSNGELGGFVGDLGASLAEAILSMELSQVERDRLVRRLEKLIDYAGDYGMEGNLDIAVQAAKYGWGDIPEKRNPLQGTTPQVAEDDELDDWDNDEDWDKEDEFELREWGFPVVSGLDDLTEAKLNVLDRQGRTEEYLALCKKEERHLRYALKLCDLKQVADAMKYAKKHLSTAEESLEVARRLRESRLVAEAIEIGEHGLKLTGPKAGLGEWLGPVEEAQGRTKQALSAWLAAFGEHPSLETYKTIKRLAGSGWKSLHPEVMTKLHKSYDKQVLAEVYLLEEEWDEAIKVAEHRDVWYSVVETVADGVMSYRPEWVTQISLRHAERLMSEPKSKNYPIAATWLKRAKQAYKILGKTDEWKRYLEGTREKYKRRPALQNQLARL